MKHIKDLPKCRIPNLDEIVQEDDLFVCNDLFEKSDPQFWGFPATFDYTQKWYYYVRPTSNTHKIKDKLKDTIDKLTMYTKHRETCKIWKLSKTKPDTVCDCGLLDNYNNIFDIIKEI